MQFNSEQLLLYAVTDRAWVGRQTLLEQIEDALAGGATLIQLREKDLDAESFLNEAVQAREICHRHGVSLIINDNVDVALKAGADGVHVGVEDAPVKEIRCRVDDALKAVGMYEFVTHAPHLLSGGQKQRIAIAGVIAMEPECIVLDEATAMLDPVGRREVLSTVHRLNREKGITVILITHHMNEAEEADRVVVMDDGKVAMDGTPREVFTRIDELRSMGLTTPDTVDLLDRLQKDGWNVPLDALTVEECAYAIAAAAQN